MVQRDCQKIHRANKDPNKHVSPPNKYCQRINDQCIIPTPTQRPWVPPRPGPGGSPGPSTPGAPGPGKEPKPKPKPKQPKVAPPKPGTPRTFRLESVFANPDLIKKETCIQLIYQHLHNASIDEFFLTVLNNNFGLEIEKQDVSIHHFNEEDSNILEFENVLVIFLNEDFEGGNLIVENEIIKPEEGKFYFFKDKKIKFEKTTKDDQFVLIGKLK